MNNSSELTTFKGSEDAGKFLYLYENGVNKILPDCERAEKIVAYLRESAFGFYFDRFTLSNAPTEEAKGYGLVKKVMLEKFSTQKTKSEIMREALTLRYDGGDILTFLSRADKAFMGYAENIKMMDGTAAQTFQQTKNFDKDPKETKIYELCKQVENLRLMMMKQPRKGPKHAEPVCSKFGKKGHYASQCRKEQELTRYKCAKNGHRASEWRSKVDISPTCTY